MKQPVVLEIPYPASTVVAVEGTSDLLAIEALARRRQIDLVASSVAIVAMGGATNIGHFLRQFGPTGDNLRLAGLCDAAEERIFRRALGTIGIGPGPQRDDLGRIGFFVCDTDLEDELIRALGVDETIAFIADQGDLRSFQTMQQMPHQRGVPVERQLRRFVGTQGGRKNRYAPLLVDRLAADRIPEPLGLLLDHAIR